MSPYEPLQVGPELDAGREEGQSNGEQLPASLQTLPGRRGEGRGREGRGREERGGEGGRGGGEERGGEGRGGEGGQGGGGEGRREATS